MSGIAALINPHSGSVPPDAAAKLTGAMEALGKPCDINVLGDEDFTQAIADCIASEPDMIIVWSGDGTVACTLEHAGSDGPPILPLPGGTMNLFHKQIHGGACAWDECLYRALSEGKIIDVPAGCAGERRFYVAAMVGSLTDLATPREAIREGKILKAFETLAGSDILDLRTNMSFRLLDEHSRSVEGFATATALFVGHSGDDLLEYAFIDPDNPLELAASGIGALFSDWRDAAGVQTLQAREVIIEEEKGYELRVTLDGEPVRLKSGTRFSRIAKAGKAISAQIE
ncbi:MULTISPECIES: diacylglycerol/lipid kinase family protein [Henriciella]|jgi:diacylglycerol kinase family enzyme|uniref:Diacylglycerol kinase n=1 Tax=Henriciella pelagia TaxID=1977912 RepID=A0ABQ1J887_9PROT|nr:diacylglycerol kinase family protein [Henriciella pelagia]GGB62177.1 diacylglycerol kinase [Henriciella pelagia]